MTVETDSQVDQRPRRQDERGQVIAIVVVFMVLLLVMAGFAIDVGHAYLVQRQLQSGVDAAALAGAQELPDVAIATQTAHDYGPTPAVAPDTKPNDVTTVDNAETTVTIKCLSSYGCVGRRAKQNGIEVTASSVVPTWFLKLIGRDSFTVHASSTACSPCSFKAFDVMLVLDRTGSMCSGGCGDLNNAKDGARAFLRAMDPGLDKVGLAVFPPRMEGVSVCTAPSSQRNAYGYTGWWPSWDRRDRNGTPITNDAAFYTVASLDFGYAAESPVGSGNWQLTSTPITNAIDCLQAAGWTSYGNALAEAKQELVAHGNGTSPDGLNRGEAQDVIVYLTDGAANVQARYGWLPTNPVAFGLLPLDLEQFGRFPTPNQANRSCRAGIAAADWAKAQNTLIYTIGYGVAGGGNQEQCNEPGMTPESTLRAMATDPVETAFITGEGADLELVFELIARDIRDRAGRLVPEGSG